MDTASKPTVVINPSAQLSAEPVEIPPTVTSSPSHQLPPDVFSPANPISVSPAEAVIPTAQEASLPNPGTAPFPPVGNTPSTTSHNPQASYSPTAFDAVSATPSPLPDSPEAPGIPTAVSVTPHQSSFKKFLFPSVLVIIIAAGFIGSLSLSLLSNANKETIIASVQPTPSNGKKETKMPAATATGSPNPFISPTPSFTNPFEEYASNYSNPFGTYINPFAPSVQASDSEYKNPFEEL